MLVLLVAAIHHIEVTGLNLLRDGATLASANGAVVQFADGRDFSGGAGEKGLVTDIDLVTRDALFTSSIPRSWQI